MKHRMTSFDKKRTKTSCKWNKLNEVGATQSVIYHRDLEMYCNSSNADANYIFYEWMTK